MGYIFSSLLELARRECVQVHELLERGSVKTQLYKALVRLTELIADVALNEGSGREDAMALPHGVEGRKIADALKEVLARLRYRYQDDGSAND